MTKTPATKGDTPADETPPPAAPVIELERPPGGGSYERRPDGSLKLKED